MNEFFFISPSSVGLTLDQTFAVFYGKFTGCQYDDSKR
jgi:hypothetical protein